jgi:hypothetical protein
MLVYGESTGNIIKISWDTNGIFGEAEKWRNGNGEKRKSGEAEKWRSGNGEKRKSGEED